MSKRKTPEANQVQENIPVSCSSRSNSLPPVLQGFPGSAGLDVAMRLAFGREPYAEIIQHAKGSLDAEICGVLVGHICRDDSGLWVNVTDCIRGSSTNHGSTHVTFTQETWTQIHAEKDRRFPTASIVGWYHSHPGFGVEFSDMDIFIHRNFFSGLTQIAFVTDPVSGEDAACINCESGVKYIDRCWIDGREKKLRTPVGLTPIQGEGIVQTRIDALEQRISSLVTTLDEMRERIWSFYLLIGMIIVTGILAFLGVQFWKMWSRRSEPPEVMSEWTVPVRVGDVDVQLIGNICAFKIPPEKQTAIIEFTKALAAQQIEEARKKAELSTSSSATAPNTQKP